MIRLKKGPIVKQRRWKAVKWGETEDSRLKFKEVSLVSHDAVDVVSISFSRIFFICSLSTYLKGFTFNLPTPLPFQGQLQIFSIAKVHSYYTQLLKL